MAIAKMKKVQLFVHGDKANAVLKTLQKLEIIEITQIDEDFFVPTCEKAITAQEVEAALVFFQELFPSAKGFIENFIPLKHLVSPEETQIVVKDQKVLKALLKTFKTQKEMWFGLQEKKAQLLSAIEKLELYCRFPVKLEKSAAVKKILFVFGIFPKAFFAKWLLEEASLIKEMAMQVLTENEHNNYCMFCVFPEHAAVLKESLAQYEFSEVVLPHAAGPFSEQLAKAKKELEKIDIAILKAKAVFEVVYKNQKKMLSVWADYLANEETLCLWSANLMHTKKVALIEGWIIAVREAELENSLKVFEKEVHVVEAPPSEDDVPPVVLKNKVVAPFDAVTMVYGLPNNKEFDPTPFLSGFFVLFFGVCLSDFGYGIMLLVLALYLFYKYQKQLTEYGKHLLILMRYCAGSTMLVGILTGSYFGIDLAVLTIEPVRTFITALKIADPLANPMPLLIFSFIAGTAQIYTGLVIHFWLEIKRNGWKEGFLNSGIWVYFITGLIGLIVFRSNTILAFAAKIVCYSGLFGLVLSQGRHKKNPLMKLFSGILSLYRLSGFIGDILSYSRLFALGLVTAVLSMVINLLAGLTGGIPYVGGIIMVLLLVGGHIFNFFINILGSFVHSARLQYVEFFTKFFEGGGRFFKPFSWKTKYIKAGS